MAAARNSALRRILTVSAETFGIASQEANSQDLRRGPSNSRGYGQETTGRGLRRGAGNRRPEREARKEIRSKRRFSIRSCLPPHPAYPCLPSKSFSRPFLQILRVSSPVGEGLPPARSTGLRRRAIAAILFGKIPMKHDTIAVIDFGGQYAHLIATKVRRLQVSRRSASPRTPSRCSGDYKGIIISGSPSLSAFGEDSGYTKASTTCPSPSSASASATRRSPSTTAARSSTAARSGATPSSTSAPIRPSSRASADEQVWMSHFDTVTEIGPDFEEIGYSRLGAGRRRPPLRGHRLRQAQALRLPVPPRGRRHGQRREDAPQLRPRHLRLPPDLDDGQLRRRADRPHPGAGRGRVRLPSGLRRRRLDGLRASCWARPWGRRGCTSSTSTTA